MTVAALFDGYGVPLHRTSALAPENVESVFGTHPICQIWFDAADPEAWHRTDADLVYALPPGLGPHQITPEHLAALVAAFDGGGRIVLFATHDDAIGEAIQAIFALVGGGHG